jgi:hypothetical protein
VASMLVLSPSMESFDAFSSEVQTMLSTLTVRRVTAPTPAPMATDGGRLVIPPPTRRLVIADLAGEWGMSDGINTTYVYRDTGNYAGTDSLHFKEKWIITADGKISLDFFGIQNGKKIAEKSTGVVTLSADGVLSIRMTNEQRYVLRGWLVTAEMTVMKLNGPWYADGIPANIFSNPEQGANLDKKWVRLTKAK